MSLKTFKKIIDNFYSWYHMITESLNNAKSSTRRFERKVNSSWQSSTWIKKNQQKLK